MHAVITNQRHTITRDSILSPRIMRCELQGTLRELKGRKCDIRNHLKNFDDRFVKIGESKKRRSGTTYIVGGVEGVPMIERGHRRQSDDTIRVA